MVWHIFKKDWKLLWPVVLGVTGLLWVTTVVLFFAMRWQNPQLGSLWDVLERFAYISVAFLVVLVIHQEPLPGIRQDWLVRPVRRRDLLLAKLLFVLLAAQIPIFAADLFQGMANGFAFPQSAAAALARNIDVLLFLILPLVALASFTRTMAESTVWVVMTIVVAGGFQILVTGLIQEAPGPGKMVSPTAFTGVEWVGNWLRLVVFLIGAALVLGLQYFRRKTVAARWLAISLAILSFFTQLLPWSVAFAVQKRLSPVRGASAAVTMAFDPSLGRAKSPVKLNEHNALDSLRLAQGSAVAMLPLQVTGLPNDSVLRADRAEVRLTTAAGKVIHLDARDVFWLPVEGSGDGKGHVRPEIRMKPELFDQLKDQPVRVEVEYSLTLFRLFAAHAVPALGGDQLMPGIARCTTTLDDEQDDVVFRCVVPGHSSGCDTMFLENPSNGRRNPQRVLACTADYAPFPLSFNPDVMGRMELELSFRDLSGLAHYPVDGDQLTQAQVVMRTYHPVEHFTRRLVIPEIKLSDWEPR